MHERITESVTDIDQLDPLNQINGFANNKQVTQINNAKYSFLQRPVIEGMRQQPTTGGTPAANAPTLLPSNIGIAVTVAWWRINAKPVVKNFRRYTDAHLCLI